MKINRSEKRKIFGCGFLIIVALVCIVADTVYEKNAAGKTGNREKEETETVFSAGGPEEVHNSYESLFPDMYVQASTEEGGQERNDSAETVSKGAEEPVKKMYLSFDDGPSNITEKILEILEDADVQATFFLIGGSITEDKEAMLKAMTESGHKLGVHTYSHNSKDVYCSVESYLEDFHKTFERIYEVTGEKPSIFRFPWGSVNCYSKGIRTKLIEEMERRGFTFYDWNVSAEDSVGTPSEYSIIHNVTDHFKKFKEPVVLMHDGRNNALSAKVLPSIIKSIQDEGYEFGTLDEMEKPYQYPR